MELIPGAVYWEQLMGIEYLKGLNLKEYIILMVSTNLNKPRRIEIGERIIDGWSLRSHIWEDSESGLLIGYNHHYQRESSEGFIEFVRFDLHKRGEPSEDAPHIHIRLQSRPITRIDDSIELFGKVVEEIPRLEGLIR